MAYALACTSSVALSVMDGFQRYILQWDTMKYRKRNKRSKIFQRQ